MFMLNFNSKDPYRPNFFEMVAQQEFIVRLKPATQYMFSVLSMRNSIWSIPTVFIDEIFFVFQYFVEKHYLHYFRLFLSINSMNLVNYYLLLLFIIIYYYYFVVIIVIN